MDFYDVPKETAHKAFCAVISEGKTPSLTDQLLYAIMAQLEKLNEQVKNLTDKEG
jgi:hypothetical protein